MIFSDIFSPFGGTLTSRFRGAWDDFRESLSLLRLAIWMGWLGTLLPFRDTKVGPYWITIICFIWAFSIGFLFNPGKGTTELPFLTYVALGVTTFSVIRTFLAEGTDVFIKESSIILNVPNPFFIYIIKISVKASINFVMSIPVIIIAMLVDGVPINVNCLLSIPGMMLLLFFGMGSSLLFASLATRYRDVRFIMQSLVRFLFFVSPVFWIKSSGIREVVAEFNPIYHLITIIRLPVMGTIPSFNNYMISMVSCLVVLFLGVLVFAMMRGRMAQWL